MSDWKINFATFFELKLFRVTVANVNIESLKSLPTLFDICLKNMLVKFEQNRMVRNIQKFELLNRKPDFFKAVFVKALTPSWKMFLYLKQLLDAKLLI